MGKTHEARLHLTTPPKPPAHFWVAPDSPMSSATACVPVRWSITGSGYGTIRAAVRRGLGLHWSSRSRTAKSSSD